jgi:hypothetical protein
LTEDQGAALQKIIESDEEEKEKTQPQVTSGDGYVIIEDVKLKKRN